MSGDIECNFCFERDSYQREAAWMRFLFKTRGHLRQELSAPGEIEPWNSIADLDLQSKSGHQRENYYYLIPFAFQCLVFFREGFQASIARE